MLKNKDFKYIYFNAGNQCYHRKVVCQVNLEIPLAVNRFISVRGLRTVAIKHLGPVVQSVVSLTSSLRVISLTVLADSIYNILIFFAEKM